MDPLRTKLLVTAGVSRLAVVALSIAANLLVPDHDAGVFLWTVTPVVPPTVGDRIVAFLTDGLTRWDGQYFLHIANNGYTYEQSLAFFPLYPLLVKTVGEFIYWLQCDYGLLHLYSCLKLSGILVSSASFCLATLVLFNLSRRVLRDDYLAYKSCLYFCISPANIFFTAVYSESLYALVSFYCMLKIERSFSFQTGLSLAVTTAVRSNALVNLGFPLYKGLKIVAQELAIHIRLKQLHRQDLNTTIANILGDAILPTVFSAVAAVAPFFLYQWYSFTKFCHLTRAELGDFPEAIVWYAKNHSLKLPTDDPSPWCFDAVPLPYNYIQSHYWNVGFLRYYTLKQLPNFALALPILLLVLSQAKLFFQTHSYYSVRLGLTNFHVDPNGHRLPPFDPFAHRVLPRDCFVYVVHAAALAVFCALCIHVQVATRLICSATPVVYWLAALITAPEARRAVPATDKNIEKLETQENLQDWFRSALTDERPETRVGRWINVYFLGYSVVGTVLFANFLPWT